MQPSTGFASSLTATDVIQSAFNDALPLMRSRQRLWIIFAVIAAIGGLILPFLPDYSQTVISPTTGNAQTLPGARFQMAFQLPNVLGAIAAFFIVGSVLRTVRPGWHWTVGTFFTAIGIGIVYGIAVEIGFFLLFVPGFFLAIKWSQVVWCYLLSEGKNPFGESWEITKGMFWRTFLFLLFLWLVLVVLLVVTYGISASIAAFVPILGVVMLPIAFLAYAFAMHVSILANVRWMLALRAHFAGALPPGTAPVPAV